MKKEVRINMETSLEARPIATMIQMASRYESVIYLETEGKRVNVKSMMGMMSLALMNGETVTLDAQGADEEAAIRALEEFLTE